LFTFCDLNNTWVWLTTQLIWLSMLSISCSEGGFFNAIMSFPSNYPNSPPSVKFTSEIWHPNGWFSLWCTDTLNIECVILDTSCIWYPYCSNILCFLRNNILSFPIRFVSDARNLSVHHWFFSFVTFLWLKEEVEWCCLFVFAVYPDGRVCISILHPPGDDPNGYELASERWTPVHTVRENIKP